MPLELKGVNVLQKTVVIVTSSSQSFHWEGYGLKLKVPAQSLPSHINSCKITLMVSLSGLYQFPADTELVSPVFWLRCEPKVQFEIPLSLEIEHCAPLENYSHLRMTKALRSQKDLPYLFNVIPGGKFSKHSSCGVIGLNHFCALAVGQEGSNECRYWSSVFYMGPPKNRHIHFTVTHRTPTHLTVRDAYN